MAETGYRHLSRPEHQHHWKYQHNHYSTNTINNNNNNITSKLPPPQRPRSPVSSSATDTTSEPETSVSGRRRRHYHQHHRPQMHHGHHHGHHHQVGHRSGTLRSTRSVPALNLTPWELSQNLECPVHGHFAPVVQQPGGYNMHPMGHQMALVPQMQPQMQAQGGTVLRRAGSMFDMREVYGGGGGPPPHPHLPPHPHQMAHYVPYHGGMMPQPERKSMYGSVRSLRSVGNFQGGVHGLQGLPPMPPAHLLPPGVRPRPLVIPVGVEPLPVRDPGKQQVSGAPVSAKEGKDGPGGPKGSADCCKGPLPLVWFIISIVTVGVILGVILGTIFG